MRRRRRRSASGPGGMGVFCLVAGTGLAAVMGIAVRENHTPSRRTRALTPMAVAPATPALPRAVAQPPASPTRALDVIGALQRRVRAAEGKMPQIKRNERGAGFEEARIALLAQFSDVRDELGIWLDEHPDDDRANRLWDHTLRLYAALRKL